MHEAAGAPPQLTDGAYGAAQSTGAAASRPILQARPLALRLHRERAIVAKNTDLCAADLHGGRAQRRDNRGPPMLARKRTRRASCSPGGGRPSSPPERPCPGSGIKKGGVFPSVHFYYLLPKTPSGRLWLECRPELRNHGVGWMRAVERLRNGGVPQNPVFLMPKHKTLSARLARA